MTKDKTEQGKLRYLSEHLSYERDMLCYTYDRLHKVSEGFEWNVLYESFCIHARNICNFLRNKEDSRNAYCPNDYVPNWSKPNHLSLFQALDVFLFHLSAERDTNSKLCLEQIQILGAWLNREWSKWIDALPEPYNNAIQRSPVCTPIYTLEAGATKHTACTAVFADSWISGRQ